MEGSLSVQAASAADLCSFMDFAAAKGMMPRATAMARRTAVKEVLATTEGDDWESIDVIDMDVEVILDRFETIASRSHRFKPQSLTTYKSRFRSAIQDFVAYRSNPGGWRPQRRSRTSAPSTSTSPPGPRERKPTRTSSVDTSPASGSTWETYRFPVRPGMMATLNLPTDLRAAEVARLTLFLQILPMDDAADDAVNNRPQGDADGEGG